MGESALQRVERRRERLDRMQMSDAGDVRSAAWRAPRTTMRTRQRLVRALITEIVVEIDEAAGEIVLVIHWKGGQHSELRVHKPRTGEHGCSTPKQALAVMRSMAGRWSDQDIAASLNRMGMPTGQGKTWTTHRVRLAPPCTRHRNTRKCLARRSERCHPWRCRRTGAVDAPSKRRVIASLRAASARSCRLHIHRIVRCRDRERSCRRRRAGLATKPPDRSSDLAAHPASGSVPSNADDSAVQNYHFDPRECHNGKDPNTLSLTRPASCVAPN